MAASTLLVWWLKGTTGVACPWSTAPFGSTPSTGPVFSLVFREGGCWPAGHATTGFCFFSLYFALRDEHPKAARRCFLFALLFGVICGAARVMQGAHFVSHVLASGLIVWLACALLALLILQPPKASARKRPSGPEPR